MSALSATDLLARAKADTGLSDWGDDSFEQRFGLAVHHINTIPMDRAGRQAADVNCMWLLTDRLKFFNDFKLYPLADEVIDHPMFATGEPRSGTTLMHALMAVDPDARALKFWELMRPSPWRPYAGSRLRWHHSSRFARGIHRGGNHRHLLRRQTIQPHTEQCPVGRMRPSGVDVLHLNIGLIATPAEFRADINDMSAAQSPEDVAQEGLDNIANGPVWIAGEETNLAHVRQTAGRRWPARDRIGLSHSAP